MTTEIDLVRLAIANSDPVEVTPSFIHAILFSDDGSGDGQATKLAGFSTGNALTRETAEDVFPQLFNEYVLNRAREGQSLEGRQVGLIVGDPNLINARIVANILIEEARGAGATPYPVLITDRASWVDIVEGTDGDL